MKNIKNNKGFTLIELLAVIVVLAIIMMIATTQVIPLISSSREGGFVSTANTILSTVETLVLADEISGKSNTSYDVDDLINNGYLSKITTSQYDGCVTVVKDTNSGTYDYTLYLYDTSNNYYINGYVSGETLTAESDFFSKETPTGYTASNYTCSSSSTTGDTTTD